MDNFFFINTYCLEFQGNNSSYQYGGSGSGNAQCDEERQKDLKHERTMQAMKEDYERQLNEVGQRRNFKQIIQSIAALSSGPNADCLT